MTKITGTEKQIAYARNILDKIIQDAEAIISSTKIKSTDDVFGEKLEQRLEINRVKKEKILVLTKLLQHFDSVEIFAGDIIDCRNFCVYSYLDGIYAGMRILKTLKLS